MIKTFASGKLLILIQVFQIVRQLRGEAGPVQVPNAKVGLAHVLGASGHCAVTILKN